MGNNLFDDGGNELVICSENCMCTCCNSPLYLEKGSDNLKDTNGIHKCINKDCCQNQVNLFPPIFHSERDLRKWLSEK